MINKNSLSSFKLIVPTVYNTEGNGRTEQKFTSNSELQKTITYTQKRVDAKFNEEKGSNSPRHLTVLLDKSCPDHSNKNSNNECCVSKVQLNLKAIGLDNILEHMLKRRKSENDGCIIDFSALISEETKNIQKHEIKNSKRIKKKNYLYWTGRVSKKNILKDSKQKRTVLSIDEPSGYESNKKNLKNINNNGCKHCCTNLTESHSDCNDNFLHNLNRHTAFSELRRFLKVIFNFDFSKLGDVTMDFSQLSIAAAIISKKFQVDFPIRSLYPIENFMSLYDLKSGKRPEESYKFVFKHAYKNLKAIFRKKNVELAKLGFNDLNLQFYKHYFKTTSEKLGISLNNFFLPLTPDSYCNKKQPVIAQTINVSYITLVCQSQNFLDDFMNYVNNSFIKDYQELIDSKIDNICHKWQSMYLETLGNEKCIHYICDYVYTNKKCKLPWTVKEVEFAIDIVNRLISKCKKRACGTSKCFGSNIN